MSLSRKLLAEYLGTTLLLATVVGSGIMGAALSRGNDGLALLANAGATAGALYVLIVNPAVTIARSVTQTFAGIRPGDVLGFAVAQIVGAMAAWVIFNALVSELNSKNDEVQYQIRRSGRALQSSPGIRALSAFRKSN